jgi:hypothetical protein
VAIKRMLGSANSVWRLGFLESLPNSTVRDPM